MDITNFINTTPISINLLHQQDLVITKRFADENTVSGLALWMGPNIAGCLTPTAN